MAIDTARLEADLNKVEGLLFRLGTRLTATGTGAEQAAASLASLYAAQTQGTAVASGALYQAEAALAGLSAEAAHLSGSGAALGGLLEQVRELGPEFARGVLPALQDLTKLAGEAADAERKRAEGLALIERLTGEVAAAEQKYAQARAAGAGEGQASANLARAGTELNRAREAQSGLDTAAADVGGRYSRGHTELAETVGAEQARRGSLTTQLGGAAQTAGALYQAPAAASGAVVGAASDLLSPLTALTGGFGQLGSMLGQFVGAFSPAIVMQFQQALQDLSATFGVALAPVMEGLTTLAREVGGVLAPVMEALAPVFEQLTQTVLAVVLPVIDVWASVLQDLVPVIAFLGEMLSNVGTLTRVAGAFMAGWIELLRQAATALGEWLGGLTGVANPAQSFTEWLKTALQSVGEAAILAAGYLAKLIGGPDSGFLAGLIKSLQPKPALAEHKDITGLGAASQAQVTTGAAFEKSALAAAFIATGGLAGPKRDTSDWLADVVKELQAIKEGKDNKVDEFLQKLNQVEVLKAIKRALDTIAEAKEAVGAAADKALDVGKHGVGFAMGPGGLPGGIATALFERYPWLFGR